MELNSAEAITGIVAAGLGINCSSRYALTDAVALKHVSIFEDDFASVGSATVHCRAPRKTDRVRHR
jgi:DNA-binding transcriptional LysR family regulator